MTHTEILHELGKMPIRDQLYTLRSALEMIESKFDELQKSSYEALPRAEMVTDDPLLALAGFIESPITDVSERHDEYIGAGLMDDHA